MSYFFSCCYVRFLFGDRETNKKQFFRVLVKRDRERSRQGKEEKANFGLKICEI